MSARALMLAFGIVTAFLHGSAPGADDPPHPKVSVLIVDGVNNHDWERATRILKSILLSGSGPSAQRAWGSFESDPSPSHRRGSWSGRTGRWRPA
jgi:hypothetical protein